MLLVIRNDRELRSVDPEPKDPPKGKRKGVKPGMQMLGAKQVRFDPSKDVHAPIGPTISRNKLAELKHPLGYLTALKIDNST